ncbi:MAG: histidine kinase, partial [Bacteroidetes bacterium]|nr:histidine kinase [Bacteroidota bacterium]
GRPEISIKEVYDGVVDSSGTIWVVTMDNGIWNIRDGRPEFFRLAYNDSVGMFGKEIYIDNDGVVIIGYWGLSGVAKIFKDHNEVIGSYKYFDASLQSVKGILHDSNGNYWFATNSKGLFKYDGIEYTLMTVNHGLNSDFLEVVYEDSEGNIWIGGQHGATKIPSTPLFQIPYNQPDKKLEITDVLVTIEEIIVSTYESGVHIARKDCEFFPLGPLRSGVYWSVRKDSKGDLLLGNDGSMILYEDQRIDTFNYYIDVNGGAQTHYDIFQDSRGIIWVATIHRGLVQFKDGDYIYFGDDHNLMKEKIHVIEENNMGDLYIGDVNGLNILSPKDEGDSTFTHKLFNTDNGLPDNNVYDILFDGPHVWFATDAGLCKLTDNKISVLGKRNGLASDVIRALVVDDNHDLWIGTINGVNRIDLDEYYRSNTLLIDHFDKSNGLYGLESSSKAFAKDDKGRVYFGTTEGLFMYDPAKEERNIPSTNPRITNVLVNYRDTILESSSELIYKQNTISFGFSTIALTNPKDIKFKTRIIGFDSIWRLQDQGDPVHFTNLSPETYTFEVKSSNYAGAWSVETAAFTFTVLPPFWEMWWFRGLMILIIGGIGYGIARVRINQVKKDKEVIANKLTALLAKMEPHFIFGALNSIQKFILLNDKAKATHYLTSFARLMRQILLQSDEKKIKLSEEITALKDYIELQALRYDGQFDYE